ncbi:hypothetical protein BHE74_00041664, partial [Ensete ventricosum]
ERASCPQAAAYVRKQPTCECRAHKRRPCRRLRLLAVAPCALATPVKGLTLGGLPCRGPAHRWLPPSSLPSLAETQQECIE